MRETLASLVSDWRRLVRDTAVVAHSGNRAVRTGYADLSKLSGRFAAELGRRGIGPGERVVLWGENSAAWIGAFFGCVLRGVLVVPLDAAGSPEFAARVLAEVAPRLLVTDPERARNLGDTIPVLSLRDLSSTLPAEPEFAVDPAVTADAPVQIVFTSGTTSEPRGVVHTHRNILASVRPIEAEIARYRRFERPFHPLRFLHTLPLSHVFGQFMGMWLPPLLGAEVHFVDSVEPARLVTLCKRERISVLVAVPRILELLRSYLLGRFPDLSASLESSQGMAAPKRWWRFRRVHRLLGFKFWALICGGATLPPELEGFWNGLGLALIQGYGMTETAALVTLNHPFRAGRGTLGKALPGREVRLSPEGEIQVRGDVLAAGVWRGGRLEPRTEEWLATGDLATQDDAGLLRFAGRMGDVIVTAAGLNVHPGDLEAALLAQPGVRGCAVVGCETARGAEAVAVLLLDPGAEGRLREIQDAANGQLAKFQQIQHVLRWPEPALPYTSTGKLLRRRVAAWAATRVGPAGGAVPAGGDALLTLIATITREPARSDAGEQRLTEDLHLDSLGRVQLQTALAQQFGLEIDETAMAAIVTLAELRALVGFAGSGSGAAAGVHRPETQGGSPAELSPPGRDLRDNLPYARWPWSAPVRWLRNIFLEGVLRPLVWLLAKPNVEWAEGAGWASGPGLVVANHVNTFDLPLLLYALPPAARRHLATAMSAELLADLRAGRGQGSRWLNLLARPAYWLLLALFNVFPLPRLAGFRRSFAHAGEGLDRGYSVLVFPEGRRGGTGVLQPFRPGIGLLVLASDAPVTPVALRGMGSAFRREGRWFRTGDVTVRIGAPLRFTGETPEEITRLLRASLAALGPG